MLLKFVKFHLTLNPIDNDSKIGGIEIFTNSLNKLVKCNNKINNSIITIISIILITTHLFINNKIKIDNNKRQVPISNLISAIEELLTTEEVELTTIQN